MSEPVETDASHDPISLRPNQALCSMWTAGVRARGGTGSTVPVSKPQSSTGRPTALGSRPLPVRRL